MRWFLLLLVVLLPLAGADATWERHGVRVTVRQIPGALEAQFIPEAGHHLYGLTLPAGSPGVATSLRLDQESGVVATGPLTADVPTHLVAGLPVFPAGPVVLRLPIAGDQQRPIPVVLAYLACTATSCRFPVPRATLMVPPLGAASGAEAPLPAPAADPTAAAVPVSVPSGALPTGVWHRPATRAAAEALLAQAGNAPVLLDFTGPSCITCQVMAKTVLVLPEVQAALSSLILVEIDTDPPHDDLATWQQERFRSQTRPLYVRRQGAQETRWSTVLAPTDREPRAALVRFLRGGPGSDVTVEASWGSWVWLALVGGLVTLLMPCTYPMVPLTLTFFAKQAAAGRRLVPLALAYGVGIMACFIGVGLLITAVFGASLSTVAGHPVTNCIIAVVFVLFGLSLLGVWFLRLPWDRWGGSQAGYVGALLMGLTFAITAFTCTAPIAGAVLSAGVATGAWGATVGGMAVYSAAIAGPLVILALVPGLLVRLPRAGAWMQEVKTVGGFLELAAALKFLVICDVAWGWGVVTRGPVLACWSAMAMMLAVYVLGGIRLGDDERLERLGPWRVLVAVALLAMGLAGVAGMAGMSLGMVEGFFPTRGA